MNSLSSNPLADSGVLGDGLDRSVSGIQRAFGVKGGMLDPHQPENSLYQPMDLNAAPVTADQLQQTLTKRIQNR